MKSFDDLFNLDERIKQCALSFELKDFDQKKLDSFGISLPKGLEHAVHKRRVEWILGRHCAKTALAALGVQLERPLGIRSDRSPDWPEGYIGSITHREEFAAAVVSSLDKVRGIGIDSERLLTRDKMDTVRSIIATPHEHDLAARDFTSTLDETLFYTLVFSAKESLFKCLYPIVQEFFDHAHAEIQEIRTTDLQSTGFFSIRLTKDLGAFAIGSVFKGDFILKDECVYTSLCLFR